MLFETYKNFCFLEIGRFQRELKLKWLALMDFYRIHV